MTLLRLILCKHILGLSEKLDTIHFFHTAVKRTSCLKNPQVVHCLTMSARTHAYLDQSGNCTMNRSQLLKHAAYEQVTCSVLMTCITQKFEWWNAYSCSLNVTLGQPRIWEEWCEFSACSSSKHCFAIWLCAYCPTCSVSHVSTAR